MVAALAAGLWATTRPGRDRPAPDEPEASAPDRAATAADATAGDASPGADAPPLAAETIAAQTEAPRFDVVRVTPEGAALVAGTAEPGARVRVTAGTGTLAEVEADSAGNFVAIFDAEPSSEPRALSLSAEAGDGDTATSDDVVMLLPAAPGDAPGDAVEDAGTGPDPAAEAGAPEPAGPSGPAAAAESGTARPQPRIAATVLLRDGEVEVTPAGPRGAPQQVALASISYAETGAVRLGGFGTAGGIVRAYVDDGLAREGRVGADGRWEMALDGVEAGRYRLRIDLVAADGTVESRVETPFQRDIPAGPRPRPGPAEPGGSLTVQPGTNLWTIARVHYGSGVLYTMIYTANRDLIRDPDLIYPGQVLAMPVSESNETE